MIVYIYCYECKIVLGRPTFEKEEVTKDYKENHQDHIIYQSDWDEERNFKS